MRERLLLVAALLAWLLTLASRGAGLLDAGTVLAGQWDLVGRGHLNPYSAPILLSDALGGLWQLLLGGPSLPWARLGGALVLGASAVAALELLARRHGRRRAATAVLATGLLVAVLARLPFVLALLVPPALALAALLAWSERGRDPAWARTLGWGALLLALLPLGSSVGLTSASYGLWFCLPAALLGAREAAGARLRPLVAALVPALAAAAALLHLAPAAPGEVVLVYNFMPMLYWLTRTRPLLAAPVVFREQGDAVLGLVEEAARREGPPRAVVVERLSPPGSPQAREADLVRGWAERALGFRRAFANGLCEIWVPA